MGNGRITQMQLLPRQLGSASDLYFEAVSPAEMWPNGN